MKAKCEQRIEGMQFLSLTVNKNPIYFEVFVEFACLACMFLPPVTHKHLLRQMIEQTLWGINNKVIGYDVIAIIILTAKIFGKFVIAITFIKSIQLKCWYTFLCNHDYIHTYIVWECNSVKLIKP